MASTWAARSAAAMALKRGLDRAGVQIPFPQRVVRHVTAQEAQDAPG
ncbi:hypothetical protein [Ornithinimicrobium kibberense]|uniref:Mechanosensitive ion channel-like protein n=1 Tax=Ornithinimicrobium kibberense TaxID=282060 RepID=A0ABV5V1J9_9MICO|nr:hypothetical protein [Ornithinimicrobium kibberense]